MKIFQIQFKKAFNGLHYRMNLTRTTQKKCRESNQELQHESQRQILLGSPPPDIRRLLHSTPLKEKKPPHSRLQSNRKNRENPTPGHAGALSASISLS